MIVRKVLRDLDAGVGHVGDTHNRRCGLRVDEITKVVETVADAGIAGVVDQNEKLQGGTVATRGTQVVNLQRRLSLLHLHILWPKDWHFAVIPNRLVGDDHVNLNGARSARTLLRVGDPRSNPK